MTRPGPGRSLLRKVRKCRAAEGDGWGRWGDRGARQGGEAGQPGKRGAIGTPWPDAGSRGRPANGPARDEPSGDLSVSGARFVREQWGGPRTAAGRLASRVLASDPSPSAQARQVPRPPAHPRLPGRCLNPTLTTREPSITEPTPLAFCFFGFRDLETM